MRLFSILAILFIAILLLAVNFLAVDKQADLLVTMIGTFAGFFLSHAGLMIYERSKEREEFISMLISARSELLMNKGTVVWINHLLEQELSEREVHGLGFSGVDDISIAAIENIVKSPLLHKFGSKEFASERSLSIYQTLLIMKREIPTDQVDGTKAARYKGIRFSKVIDSFALLIGWLDAEATRICGKKRWTRVTQSMIHPEDRLRAITLKNESLSRNVKLNTDEAQNRGGFLFHSLVWISALLYALFRIRRSQSSDGN